MNVGLMGTVTKDFINSMILTSLNKKSFLGVVLSVFSTCFNMHPFLEKRLKYHSISEGQRWMSLLAG